MIPTQRDDGFLQQCSTHIAADFQRRAQAGTEFIKPWAMLIGTVFPRKAFASNTVPFTPVSTLTPEQVISVDQESGELDLPTWVARGMTIRGGDTYYQCVSNLTAALDLVGQLNNAEYNGAAGALSLLPTAGALLGAPTREMWYVYKLVPVAGILSMFLSLGGSITPSNVGDYNSDEPLSYGGYMPASAVTAPVKRTAPPTNDVHQDEVSETAGDSDAQHRRTNIRRRHGARETPPQPTSDSSAGGRPMDRGTVYRDPALEEDIRRFAEQVRARADVKVGGSIFLGIWFAMALQLGLIITMLIPMYYAQRGAVVTWWCRVWGWMWFWYFLVTAVAIFDNLVAAPFTKSWTIRVSQAPRGIITDPDTTRIYEADATHKITTALQHIKAGPVLNQRLRMREDTNFGLARTCFYVVISVSSTTTWHEAAQILAKCSSVAVFAFGTALFASATLMSISVALMVLCLTLPAGVAGRVIAIWIVAQMNRHSKPILHKMVRTEADAGEYIDAIARLDNIQLEINGHVVIQGVVVASRHTLFTPSTYIGLLAKPFDISPLVDRVSMGFPMQGNQHDYNSGERPDLLAPQGKIPTTSMGFAEAQYEKTPVACTEYLETSNTGMRSPYTWRGDSSSTAPGNGWRPEEFTAEASEDLRGKTPDRAPNQVAQAGLGYTAVQTHV